MIPIAGLITGLPIWHGCQGESSWLEHSGSGARPPEKSLKINLTGWVVGRSGDSMASDSLYALATKFESGDYESFPNVSAR